jgi:murein DD-endopeptidase MepM/ murein hydrolase activator NlpD
MCPRVNPRWAPLVTVHIFASLALGCGVEGVVVPDDHPCPDIALSPSQSSLWDELLEPPRAAPVTLLVPLEPSAQALVSQGQGQLPTHVANVAYAWDFEVPEATVVLAAAPGVVVWVRDDSAAFGDDTTALDDANWIVVDHGGGLFSSYVHLAAAGALVAAGDVVDAGSPLATTGLSGQLTGAHLHFQVENVWSESLPAAFVSLNEPLGCDWVPVVGEPVSRAPEVADDLVWTGQASQVPPDAFAAEGVQALHGAPARLFSRRSTYAISGRVGSGLDEVWVLVFPEDGGDAVAWEGVAVTDGRFAGELHLSAIPAGRYGWAAVAVAAGVTPEAPRSIRFTLTD